MVKMKWDEVSELASGEITAEMWDSDPNRCSAIIAMRAIKAAFEEPDEESSVSDLICNLKHLCDATGIDFFEEYDRARNNYSFEVHSEEGDK